MESGRSFFRKFLWTFIGTVSILTVIVGICGIPNERLALTAGVAGLLGMGAQYLYLKTGYKKPLQLAALAVSTGGAIFSDAYSGYLSKLVAPAQFILLALMVWSGLLLVLRSHLIRHCRERLESGE